MDTDGLQPDARLVSLERRGRRIVDLLATYLLHPGTALYVGFTDRAENLAFEEGGLSTHRTDGVGLSTGRQLFVKVAGLLPF